MLRPPWAATWHGCWVVFLVAKAVRHNWGEVATMHHSVPVLCHVLGAALAVTACHAQRSEHSVASSVYSRLRNDSFSTTSLSHRRLTLVAFGRTKISDPTIKYFQRKFKGFAVEVFDTPSALGWLRSWNETDALRAFEKLSHDVMRADLFKYVSMYRLGGYYLDVKSGFQEGRDVGCLERLSRDPWFALNRDGRLTTWNMFSVVGSPMFAYVKDAIVEEILHGRTPHGTRFEEKVWDTTGPLALRRHLKRYTARHGGSNTQLSETECLVFDRRGAGASWQDQHSYHKMPDATSVYM